MGEPMRRDGEPVAVIGRLDAGAFAPWFGIARTSDAYRLVFGEDAAARLVRGASPGDARRDLMLALAAFFEGDAAPPPPELEATQSDAAAAMRWLVESEPDGRAADALRRALDAIDDGMPPDVIVGELYTAMTAAPFARGPRSGLRTLDELRDRYRSAKAVD
ncbi:MAG: hypothetical protein ABR509_06345 [Candidatus Limnocylindria bacterium]